jgi:hypothetical protein
MDKKTEESFYVSDTPDLSELKAEFDSDSLDMSQYIAQCQDSYDDRNALWAGKTDDLQKHGENAFPWDGASDQEVRLIEQCINTYVALMMNSLRRSNITANPVESNDITEARIKGMFLKWMKDSYIKDFYTQAEIAANTLLEKGIAFTYVDWEIKKRKHKEPIDLDQIEQISPELYDILGTEGREDEAVALFETIYESVDKAGTKAALKDLREIGKAEIPVVKKDVSRPIMQSKFVDSDIRFPSYVSDIQRSPRVHVRMLLTPSEIENSIENDGWDAEVGRELIEKHRGLVQSSATSYSAYERTSTVSRGQTFGSGNGTDFDDIVEIVYTYKRMIDRKDGAEGMYLTIWSPQFGDAPLKHELLSGVEQYPFVCTKLFNNNKRIQDVPTFSDILRGPQNQAKIVRDGWSDNQAITISPPFLHPVGRAPEQMGAGAWIGVRQNDTYRFLDVPNTGRQGIEIEKYVQMEARDLVGLNPESPYSQIRQQFIVDKFLKHIADVLKLAYRCFILYGPDELFFRVTGQADPIEFLRGPIDDELDVSVSFDTMNNDPDTVKAKTDAFLQLARTSSTNRFNVGKVEEFVANMIDPVIADFVVQPAEQAQEEILKDVTSDLSKIYAGIPVGAKSNGGEMALSIIQEYIQQPSTQAKIESDPSFAQNLQVYASKYEQQITQQQNAEIGRLGAAPAELGQFVTESI